MYKIDYYKWGIISIDGKEYKNDIKIYPDEIIPDWWRSIGHKLLGADIPELRGKNIDFLIVGCGAYGALHISSTAIQLFKSLGITWNSLKTEEAVKEYNRLVDSGENAGGFFHLTC